MSIDIKLIELIQKNWENPKFVYPFLLILFIMINLLFGDHDLNVSPQKIDITALIFSIIIPLIIFIFWKTSTKLPRRKKGDIFIIIGIQTENEKEKTRLKNSFIHHLNEVIESNKLIKYKIKTVSDYHSITFENYKDYHKKTKAHFIIFGNCVERKDNSNEKYVLDLHASVVHKLLPEIAQKSLQREMNEVFAHHTIFPTEMEFTGFQVASENIGYASKYIIGLASLLSFDPFTSFNIHYPLFIELSSIQQKDDHISKIYKLLIQKVLNECQILIDYNFKKEKYESLGKSLRYIDIKLSIDPEDHLAHLMKGLYYFWVKREINPAKKEILKCSGWQDISWRYSVAFLYAYEGNLDNAYDEYKKAFRGDTHEKIPLDVIEFIVDILEKEPDKYQLNYCLGLIYYKYIRDYTLSKKYFEDFIDKAKKENKYINQISYAEKWLEEIKNKHNL